jgi:hypothetical protein
LCGGGFAVSSGKHFSKKTMSRQARSQKEYIADDGPGMYDSAMSLAEIKQLATQLPPEELTALTSFLVRLTQNAEGEAFNGALLSESVLRREWNSPEEDAAWENL